MTALYLFAAAAGVPVVLWFLLNGDESGDDGAGGDDGIAAVMGRLLPLSSLALGVAGFGVTGLALGLTGASSGARLVAALVVAVLAAALNTSVFAYVRRSESTSDVSDAELAGSLGRVVLPVGPGRRGRIAITVGQQQLFLSAEAMPDAVAALDRGDAVVVVEVRNGIARIAPLELP